MRKALTYSFISHVCLVVILLIGGLGFSAAQPPPKVYKIKLISTPPPSEVKERPVKETGHVKPAPPVEVKKIKPKKKKPVEEKKKEESRRPKVKEPAVEKKGVGGVELEGEEFPFPYYLELFIGKISRNWKNPIHESENNLSAHVYFKIARSGRIADVALKQGSGNFIYDQAAMRAVLASNPLPPLPEGYEGDFLGVTCEIIP
jgi:TonB family protein